jgi:TolB protein
MRNRWKGFIVQALVILVLGYLVSIASASGQKSQNQETSTQAGPPVSLQEKMGQVQDLVQQKQEEEANLQPAMQVMQGLGPLMQEQKFSEAEALLDQVLKLLAEAAPAVERTPSGDAPLVAYGARDADGRQQIFAVKPDGTGLRRLTEEGKQNFFPAWSPNGRKLAFTSDRSSSLQIWVMNADGSRPRQLTTEGENMVPTWSPDGKRIAFGSKRTGHFEIWAMDYNGKNQKQLTSTDVTVGNNAAAWSPDGHRIAFSSTRSGHYAIWVMDPDGDNLTQLTTPHGDRYPDSNAPAWSPDGTKIAFWSGLEHKYGNIWVMDADGTNRKQLTDQPMGINCDEPEWSADGTKIMFASNRPGSEGIGNWIMDADGSNQRVLVANTSQRGRPAWQPVGGQR